MTLKEAISWMNQPGIMAMVYGMDRHTRDAIIALLRNADDYCNRMEDDKK